jgi:hypothetical protein
MTNIVTEKNEDGSDFIFDSDVIENIAESTMSFLLKIEQDGMLKNYKYIPTVYAVFQNCIDTLTSVGFTEEELTDCLVEVANMNSNRVLN